MGVYRMRDLVLSRVAALVGLTAFLVFVGVLPVAATSVQDSPPAPGAAMTALVPAPGWAVAGSVTVTRDAAGGLQLQVSAVGPPEQLARPDPRPNYPNLIWHVITGDCATWRTESSPRTTPRQFQVLYRFSAELTAPGHETFRLKLLPASQPVDVPHLGSQPDGPYLVELLPSQIQQPLALAAFVNGGGSLVTCADIPTASPVPALPVAGYGHANRNAPLGLYGLVSALGLAFLCVGIALFARQQGA